MTRYSLAQLQRQVTVTPSADHLDYDSDAGHHHAATIRVRRRQVGVQPRVTGTPRLTECQWQAGTVGGQPATEFRRLWRSRPTPGPAGLPVSQCLRRSAAQIIMIIKIGPCPGSLSAAAIAGDSPPPAATAPVTFTVVDTGSEPPEPLAVRLSPAAASFTVTIKGSHDAAAAAAPAASRARRFGPLPPRATAKLSQASSERPDSR